MKLFLSILVLLACQHAFADIRQCTQTLNEMASITNDYATAVNTCRTYSYDSQLYSEASQIARECEALYPQLVNQCLQVCGGEANSLAFCGGHLSGACP